jgi:hypothetical protein
LTISPTLVAEDTHEQIAIEQKTYDCGVVERCPRQRNIGFVNPCRPGSECTPLPVNANVSVKRERADRVSNQRHRTEHSVDLEHGLAVNESVRQVTERQVIASLENGLERCCAFLKQPI